MLRIDDPGAAVLAAVQARHDEDERETPVMEKLKAMMKQLQAMLRNVIRKA